MAVTWKRRPRGMTFPEVLITLAILAIAILALAPLFIYSVKTNASSSELSMANTLAREKLEELMLFPTTDSRMQIPSGSTVATFSNDLPRWWNPSTGATSTATSSPGAGWFPYAVLRSYTVQAYRAQPAPTPPLLVTCNVANENTTYNPVPTPSGTPSTTPTPVPVVPTPFYDYKLVTITVQPAPATTPGVTGIFPGLRRTTQSAYVRFRNAQPN
jgi:prepilin-type N-terminal cleavage/methylation domain-containing protein